MPNFNQTEGMRLLSSAAHIYKFVSVLYPFRRSSGGHSTAMKSTDYECVELDHDQDDDDDDENCP